MDSTGTRHDAVQPAAGTGLQCSGAVVTTLLTLGATLLGLWTGSEQLRRRSRGGEDFASRVVWMHGNVYQIEEYLVEVRTPIYIPTATAPLVVDPSPAIDASEPAPSISCGAPVLLPEVDDEAPGLSGLLGEWADASGEWIAWSLVLVALLVTYGAFFYEFVLSGTPRIAGATEVTDAVCVFRGYAPSFLAPAVLDKADATNRCTDLVPWVVVGLQALVEAALASVAGTEAPGDSALSFLVAPEDWLKALLYKADATNRCTDLVPWVVVGLQALVEAASASVAGTEAPGDSALSFLAAPEDRPIPRVALPHGKWYLRKEIARVYLEDDAERVVGAGEYVEWTIPQHSTKHLVWMLSEGDERERIRKRGSVDNRDFAKRLEKRRENRKRALEANSLAELDGEWTASMVVDPLLVSAGTPRVALPRRAEG
jgi:hypothetical protein